MVRCPFCDRSNADDAQQCAGCGASLLDESIGPASASAPASAPTGEEPTAPPPGPQCLDCLLPMEPGFLPDLGHGAVFQLSWYAGQAQYQKFFGFLTGNVKIDKKLAIKVVAYRCPACGLLRLYA